MRGVPADRPWSSGPAPSFPGSLADALDRHGHPRQSWLTGALAGTGSPVLDLRRPALSRGETLEMRCGEAGPTFVGPGHLPVRTNGVAAARLDMCLPSVTALDELFAELRRVLRPTGTLAALVPSRPIRSLGELRGWWPLRGALAGHHGFRHESARDNLSWLLAGADFAVLLDQRRTFRLPVPDGQTAARVVDGLVASGVWPPDLEPRRLTAARLALARYAAPGRTLPIPLRLLVARR